MDYLKIYNILDSTNKEAHRLLVQNPIPDGFTLLALHQTDGRGQLARPWISEAGKHLSMTIIHHPHRISPAELPALGMKTSLGIINALLHLDHTFHPLIKWPNDIYLQGKKLGGILIENSLSGTVIQHSIIGIGINVNESQFPDDLPNAISLAMVTQKFYDLLTLAELVRKEVMACLHNHSPDWKYRYDQFVFGQGEIHSFNRETQTLNAQVRGVSIHGEIVLQTPDDGIQSFRSNEIRWMI